MPRRVRIDSKAGEELAPQAKKTCDQLTVFASTRGYENKGVGTGAATEEGSPRSWIDTYLKK